MGYYAPTRTRSLSYPDYAFNILGVDIREDGIYLGTDSGCSCPSYWENHTKDDFTGPLTVEQAREEAMSLWENTYDSLYDPVPTRQSSVLPLTRRCVPQFDKA